MKLELKLEALQMTHLAEMEKLLQLWVSFLFSHYLFSEKIDNKRMKDTSKGVFRQTQTKICLNIMGRWDGCLLICSTARSWMYRNHKTNLLE